MSLTQAATFECPYCMTFNDLEVDEQNDVGQTQIVDCQVCCQPIDITIVPTETGWYIIARRDDE